jgi:hypothetical protein
VNDVIKQVEQVHEEVSDGDIHVEPVRFLVIPLIDVRIQEAHFDWLEDPIGDRSVSGPPTRYSHGACFAYLGEANGFIVGLDPETRVVLRIPEDKVVMFRGEGACRNPDLEACNLLTPDEAQSILGATAPGKSTEPTSYDPVMKSCNWEIGAGSINLSISSDADARVIRFPRTRSWQALQSETDWRPPRTV